MKGQAIILFILFLWLLPYSGWGQDPPFAEFLTADAAWCELSDNHTVAEILITGVIDTSRFDLIMEIQGIRDTLVNLPSGIFSLFLNNRLGINEYIIFDVIEHQEFDDIENEVNDTLIMEVFPWPDMSFTAEYDSPCSPVDVIFRATENYPSYTWDFGDGTGSSTSTNWVGHSYSSQEDVAEINLQTWLRIETEFGCVDSVSKTFTYYPTPIAAFQLSPELLHYPNTTVSLTNTTTPGSWDFQWDFGDASSSNARNPGEHTYLTWGIYNIVMGWSTEMCQGSVTRLVEIRPPKPSVAFYPAASGCPPLPVSFTNSTLYADSYLWDFDDGNTSTEPHPSHLFQESGTYQVKLVATGISGTDSTERTIHVFDSPLALFEPDMTETKSMEEPVSFQNNSVNAVRFLWDFGDGTTSEEENPAHIYQNTGSYTVTLYTWSTEECTDTLVREGLVTVHGGEGSISFPTVFRWNESGPTGGAWTPGSEDNTVFHPDLENVDQLRMVIFTRLGHRIFETREVYVGWDGYINSSHLAAQGVYIYKAWITYSDGKEEVITGDVTFLH